MNLARRTPEETRQCILVAAWDLFRQIGFRKTTVADIAETLGMSSANIYRFFPSKDALTEAICRDQLDLLVGTARKMAAGPGAAGERIRAVLMALYRDLRDQMTNHKRVHEVVAVAMEENWPAIEEFLDACKRTVAGLVAQGQASGRNWSWRPGDARRDDDGGLRRHPPPDFDRPMLRGDDGRRRRSSASRCARSPTGSPPDPA